MTQDQLQPSVGISDSTPVTCDECGGQLFQEVIIIRRISAILTGTGKPGLIPIPTFACTGCGHVNAEFLPRELLSESIG